MAIAADMKLSYPPELPVSARRDDLLQAIGDNQVVIVAGQTGSGKTTQLPKICLELGRRAIAHTQPRRIAARTVATRIAEELGVPLGSAVGYAVRFDDRSGSGTLVRLVTDGLLLAEIQRDRLLRRYDTIILDEAHERSLNIDFLLGYLKQLLPRRPDLKLVITSATIDTGRFSEHFGDAPVVEVSGRTYPVEVRYRPAADEDDPVDAIGDAVEELLHDAPGDVLVFLSGEREIRDTAEALAGRLPQGTGILPLYARLSPAEQQRVFKPHAERRVVLATNVAETSLTVPGIGAVVDPGTARISRYSARLKVQRLPIEPISQASANQRMGRCGRTSDGICIRLYSEQDFLDRPAFTDPEILRTSLAAVILQMEALALGEIEDFGFLDPPDRRQIRDGKALLHELGALNPDAERAGARLTKLGRRLAQLPVDPRIGRMVLEADLVGCADEVVVIAAALSIQDPRIRPGEKRAEADERHARFKDERSDFLAYLNLWRHLRMQQRELSRSAFRKLCHADYLHYMRVREWQDLAGQLRQAARNVGVTINEQPAAPDDVHRALLAGLLSHIGLRDGGRREYDGARGARFTLSPGSALGRKQPTWVMVAELVETNRLWGHTAAQIQPRWIEPLAGHLLKRTYAEPHWERKRASVVALERATLYGVPVVAARTVAYGAIDPELSRELFIRHALLEGDWVTPHRFMRDNRDMLDEVEELEHRARRRDIVATERELYDFYDARIPPQVVSGAHFDRWWKDERRRSPGLLNFTRELLVGDAGLDERALPTAWRQDAERELALSYRFEPGTADDGVTVHVPLSALMALRDTGFDWLVPGLREELVTALIRSLPKELRRPLVPIPETAAQVVAGLRPRRGALVDAVARELERLRGVRVDPGEFDLARLPAHLRMRFAVEDEHGTTIAAGEQLAALRDELRPRLRAQLAAAIAIHERSGLRDWTIGELPRSVALPGMGESVAAYPALVDEGATVGVRAFETPAAQATAMQAGTRRLLALVVPSPLRAIQRGLGGRAALTLAGAPHGGPGAVLDDALVAACDALIASGGGPAWDDAGFAALREHVAQGLAGTTTAIVRDAVAVLDAASDLRARLAAIPADPALQPARLDVAAQLGGLVHPGFIAATGADRLPDVVRYLRGAVRRLDRLPHAVAADRDRMSAIAELEREYRAHGGRQAAPAVHWMLQELRVAQFAQGLGVQGTASAKQVRRALAAI
ncbi:MAG TPA: ATP-dependent RNA helicase HrpA [Solirubrobacteraceae bacterium]|jgi:ATP-dependent helicase HrpA|nr:ATP-dependent RNA helicase HrpA [Solirubrobacteraceae bacterium]